jgi:hypothetical protein
MPWSRLALLQALLAGSAAAQSIPFWDNFPRIVQFQNQMCSARVAAKAAILNADVVACNTGADPDTGIWAQRINIFEDSEPHAIGNMHASGLRTQTYFETFGQAKAFVIAVRKNAEGLWIKDKDDPALTRRFFNHWSWDRFDGSGEVRWAGTHSYFNDEDFARPYTLTHPRYGSPPVRYPDGSIATGYRGPDRAGHGAGENDPRNSRIYDACAAKDVNGSLSIEYAYNIAVEEHGGPYRGLIETGSRHAGSFDIGKDAACPSWTDYARATALQAVDNGVDSVFTDNFSPWDSFGFDPVKKAFGEWSVATFRDYLAANFSRSELSAMGVPDLKSFDVRVYLRTTASSWGGSSENLNDPIWKDKRWLDDPIWRAYKIHRRQNGSRALAAYYRAVKEAAASAGKPDFAVTGNDFQGFNLGWARGDLDMVNSELEFSRAAPLAGGKYGYMPPPLGSYVPVYKRAREQARGRIGIFWLYVPPELGGKPGIADVLQYQALANNVMPEPWTDTAQPRTAGTDATTAAFNAFVGSARSAFGMRTGIEEIGLYYSSSSELAHLTLNGWPDAGPVHSLSFLGWGTALTWLHQQWRAVPEWKLNEATLAGLKLLIIPDAEVFDPDDVPILAKWASAGGRLIITGKTDIRGGERRNFQILKTSSLSGIPGARYIVDDPGSQFANLAKERVDLLPEFADALQGVGFEGPVTGSFPYTIGVTLYDDPRNSRRFLDFNNTAIDINTDTIHLALPIHAEVKLPVWLQGLKLKLRMLTPDGSRVTATLSQTRPDAAEIGLAGMIRYASLLIEPER